MDRRWRRMYHPPSLDAVYLIECSPPPTTWGVGPAIRTRSVAVMDKETGERRAHNFITFSETEHFLEVRSSFSQEPMFSCASPLLHAPHRCFMRLTVAFMRLAISLRWKTYFPDASSLVGPRPQRRALGGGRGVRVPKGISASAYAASLGATGPVVTPTRKAIVTPWSLADLTFAGPAPGASLGSGRIPLPPILAAAVAAAAQAAAAAGQKK